MKTNLPEVTASQLLREQRITLNEVARRSDVNPSTAWRWALKGVRGVVLETYALGVKRYTTVEALERFSERCTAASVTGHSAPTARTEAQVDRETEAAIRELEAMGA